MEGVMDLDLIRKTIEEGNIIFGEAFRRGDAAAVAELYTADALLLPPNSEKIYGKNRINEFWAGAIKMGATDVTLTSVHVFLMGHYTCEIGQYNLTIEPQNVPTIEDKGKYLVIWKEQDGNWKLHIDIWNTNLPVQ